MARKKKPTRRRRNTKLDAPDAFSKETDAQVQDWLRQALERPGSFGLMGHPKRDEMFRTWSLGPVVVHRDSPILDKANWEVLRKRLESDPSLADDWFVTHAGHWAVGWVDHLSFRAIDPDGSPSRMARILKDWNDQLSAYSIADEELYSRLQTECFERLFPQDALDAVRAAGLDEDDLPADWEEQLWEATREYERGYHSGDCPYVRVEDFAEAIGNLGWKASNPNGPMAIKERRRRPTSQQTKKTRGPKRGRKMRPYHRALMPRPYEPPRGMWERAANPKKGKRGGHTRGDAALAAGVGSLLGALGGFIVVGAVGGALGALAGAEMAITGATLGAISGAAAGSYYGAYQGGKRYAPRGEEKGAAWGGAIGNWVFGPIGAGVGAYIGAAPNPGRAPNQTSYGPYYVVAMRPDPRTRQLRRQYLRRSKDSPELLKYFNIDDAIRRAQLERQRGLIYHWVEGAVEEPGVGTYNVVVWDPEGRGARRYLVANGPRGRAAAGAFAGSVAGGMLGSLAGPVAAYAGNVVGAGLGANMAAPAGDGVHRAAASHKDGAMKGGMWGGAIGGSLGAPIGAAIGAGGKSKRSENPGVRRLRNRLKRK